MIHRDLKLSRCLSEAFNFSAYFHVIYFQLCRLFNHGRKILRVYRYSKGVSTSVPILS